MEVSFGLRKNNYWHNSHNTASETQNKMLHHVRMVNNEFISLSPEVHGMQESAMKHKILRTVKIIFYQGSKLFTKGVVPEGHTMFHHVDIVYNGVVFIIVCKKRHNFSKIHFSRKCTKYMINCTLATVCTGWRMT